MLQRRRGLLDFNTLDFVSETVEVATFITQEPAHDLRARDTANPAPYTLHAVFLDAASGKIMKTLEWPVPDSSAGIFSRYDGTFLFFSTERIVLYSADWQPVKELPLPQLRAPHASLIGIAESPTGKTLVIYFRNDQSRSCIRVDTGKSEGSEEPCAMGLEFAVSDEGIAAHKGRDTKKEIDSGPQFEPDVVPARPFPDSAILIRAKAGESAYTLCEAPEPSPSYCVTPQFITDQLIALFGDQELAVSDLKGRATVVFKQIPYPPDNQWIDHGGRPVRPSADGQRFALALNEFFFQGPGTLFSSASELPAEYPDRIQVYDVRANNWIYVLSNTKKQFSKIWGLAISPSGSRLAVDSGGMIQTYILPETNFTPGH